MAYRKQAWWKAEKGSVHKLVMEYVESVESAQFDLFDRFVKLDALYDSALATITSGAQAMISTNVIASNVDTVYAVVAATEVRARFMTDDGDWSTQRQARHLEWYADGLSKLLDLDERVRRGFKSAALKGTGLIKIYIDQFDRIRAERTMVDDIVVDEAEVRAGTPRQMHQRMIVDCEELKASFPDYEEEIERAPTGSRSGVGPRLWADYRPVERDEVVCIESWYLPIGVKGKKGYRPGRHTITFDGCDLEDEEYHDPFFPFAKITWSERESGWYGIGLAERIVGHQRIINKSNWQADRQLDQHAVPTTYVSQADANIAVKTRGPLGTIAVTKGGTPPVTVIPQAVSPETYKRIADAVAGAFEESGVSRMAAQSAKPAGLDSGVALREYRDATTQRFSPQEKAHEKLKLDAVMLALSCAKKLGSRAPTIVRRSKYGPREIEWGDVDMGEVRVQIAAASNLSKTPAGRVQLALEWAQAGVISQDEARRLMQHPDTERSMSLYTAALEDIERCIEAVLDGEVLVPEPYQNLKMGIWRFQQALLKATGDGAPEDVLEIMRQWIVIAADVQSKAMAPQPQDMAMSAGPMGPADMAGPMPPMDPAQAAMAAGPPMDMGATMTGAGVMPANLLQ